MPWAVDGGQQHAPMGGQMTPGRKRSLFRFSEIGIEHPIRENFLYSHTLDDIQIDSNYFPQNFKIFPVFVLEF